ncbi:hypothetical protein Geob_2188 [Geotalea daltonii FRC-32]|uniref:Uncharacterized protein n=1 Tax=Geotalea daltonii (strain DSM 22248 / JCM 15807 / FRC-32) TaxID=316067 RepID=B9M9H0_GEODF|nr:MbcA/ParS/Xre antitoxin family protein [Geotalea daltonii]ACM20542.1 hypothetical protein Geob_2188 [Geotalea daltonii FRC-32]
MPQAALDNHRVDLSVPEARGKMAKLITRLFDLWDISTSDQLNLLGLSETSRSLLSKYRRGEPLPPSRDVQDRVGWLLAIHKALRLLYPQNEELRYSWVTRRNLAFNNMKPLDLMLDEGIIGIAKVSRYLDLVRGM